MKRLLWPGMILTVMSGTVAAEQPWSAAAELGGTMTTGNTETSTIKAKVDATHTIAEWKNRYYGDVLYSEDEKEKTASRWKVGARGDYALDDNDSLFAMAEYEQDDFSAYNSVSNLSAGYSRHIYQSERALLDGDIGLGIKSFDLKEGKTERTGVLRLGVNYENKLSETSKFTQLLVSDVAFESEESTVSRSETAVTANIYGELAMKLGFTVRHDNNPGEGQNTVDTETTVTLLYTL